MIYVNEHVDELDLESALAKVSVQRRMQALKFRYESSQRLCLAVYLLLMEGLHEEYNIKEPPIFDYTPEGKPFIASHPNIHFSFSHSGTVAVCCISSQPVGIDVETPRKISPSLIAYTMNDNEQSLINASKDMVMRFLCYWTKKEAVLKLTAKGISNDLKNVLDEAEQYQIETVKTDSYVYSIAKWKESNNNTSEI